MEKVQIEFEVWAKTKGLDVLALCPSDRLAEDRWYYEESTQIAYESWLHCNNRPELAVWYGSMPESNGKTNWTAILYRKGGETLSCLAEGITIDRSEYPERVRYEADKMRHLIGEIDEEPWILDYDSEKHSGYVKKEF